MERLYNNDELFVWEQNASPLLLALTLPNIKELKELLNIGHFTTIVLFEKNNQAKWFFRKNECKFIGNKICDCLKSDDYFNSFEKTIKYMEKRLLKEIKQIENNNYINNLSIIEVTKLFKNLEKMFNDYFKYAVLVEPIEWYTEDVLKNYINKLNIDDKEKKKILQYLLITDEDCFSYKIIENLKDCSILLENFLAENKLLLANDINVEELAKKIFNFNLKSKSYDNLINALNTHSKLYYWKKNNYYSTKYIKPEDILIELLQSTSNINKISEKYIADVTNMNKNKEKLLNAKNAILEKFPDNIKKIVKLNNKFGGKLGDDRKRNIMKVNSAFDKILKAFENITKIPLKDIHMLIPNEIEDFSKNYNCYKERFIKRKNHFVIYQSDFALTDDMILDNLRENKNLKLEIMNTPIIAEDKQAEELLLQLNKYYNLYNETKKINQELKGTVIYSENNLGKIKGIVKIIKNPKKDIIDKNEILVTTSTTPDFIDSIYKCKAVITDWGGLTSHAAIITRELRKTCVIGTNYATSILKNGDLIEIDTQTGLINKIKECD